jgi:hypothetical protein
MDHDPLAHGEPETGPARLGGEERDEDAIEIGGRDARAPVSDHQLDVVSAALGPNGHRSFATGVECVEHQV